MIKETFSRTAYTRASTEHASSSGPATKKAEQEAKKTGKLNPLVDPAGYGAIRRSLPRFVQTESGLYLLSNGTPMSIEDRLDTTGSMGGNVDVALRVLPDTYELLKEVLPNYDIQLAIGIFGDVSDDFVLCRPQFEMTADKIVKQLTLMVPERDGGDFEEDPHYGLFGGAYLTSAYINKIGLKGYDFTISDAPARELLEERQLRRIFGDDVFKKVEENGYQIKDIDQIRTKDVVQDLLKITHAFFIQINNNRETTSFWTEMYGAERIIKLPDISLLPVVQAIVVGLTEGIISLSDLRNLKWARKYDIDIISRAVANVPLREQAKLPNFKKIPKQGDLFKEKTDLWPIDPKDIIQETKPSDGAEESNGPRFL